MASKRDLVDAHGYNRRRLVAAFVSGAPAGRDVESVSRARPVVAGAAVAALLLGGSALTGVFTSPLEDGWSDAHVVIARQSAARFVSAKGKLYPVLNATSARLMLPAQTGYRVIVVDDDKIASTERGEPRGIIGAPDDLPPANALLPTGWVSCLAKGEIRTTVRSAPAPARAAAPNSGAEEPGRLVSSAGQTWLVARGQRFAVPPASAAALQRELRLDRSEIMPVPGSWLDLLSNGPQLRLVVPGRGQPIPPDAPAGLAMGGKVTAIGQVVGVAHADGGTAYGLIVPDGTVQLTPFAAAVYRAQEPTLGQPIPVTPADLAAVAPSPRSREAYPTLWPEALPTPTDGVLCAVLDSPGGDRPPGSRLVVVADDDPLATAPVGARVEPGRGALVRVNSTGAPAGPVYVIEQSGRKFAIVDPSEETLARLGYSAVTPGVVPGPWILLFPSGPALSEAAALRSPGSPAAEGP